MNPTPDPLRHYREVWAADFEFKVRPGGRPEEVHCVVARELRSGRLVRLWLGDGAPALPPYPTGSDTLFVAYYASAELGCHLALDWPLPTRILDLCVEFRRATSGLAVPCGKSLLGALMYYGLDGLAAVEKGAMRQLAMRGSPYTATERAALLDYCETDVDPLFPLLQAMLPGLDLPRALLRGRYMAAAARMEWAGVPIDTEALARLRDSWERIKSRLVATVDRDFGVFAPTGRRELDPHSTYGAAVLREAREWGLDPDGLAEAVECAWAEEKAADAEAFAARRAARRVTGLSVRRIMQWENAGKDHATYPGLDTMARELAGAYPGLGIGPGYAAAEADDPTDYPGRLWEVLRDRTEVVKPRHDPGILRRAAELVASGSADSLACYRPMSFSVRRFNDYLVRKGIPWPLLDSGALALDDDTFKEMAKAYPREIGPIRELRYTLSQLRLQKLTVGPDGRNRCLLSAFQSKTGRNQPSNNKFIFGPSVWLRSLIRPEPGQALAYCDWAAQEYGIAAALSGDLAMQQDYLSGDPYMSFARRAGAVPADATKKTHGKERDLFKVCCGLGAMYGAGKSSLAMRLGISPAHAQELLHLHRETYPVFWRWSDAIQDFAMLHNYLETTFGWRVHVPPGLDPKTGKPLASTRSLRNFCMQGNGSEMLRLACCLATERGIAVCAPVHDALLVEGSADDIENVAARTQEAMREASELVLPGFPLRTDAKVIKHPDRYQDDRGRRMWEVVWGLLEEVEAAEGYTYQNGTTTDTKMAHPAPSLYTSVFLR
jgi:hypothetical protein